MFIKFKLDEEHRLYFSENQGLFVVEEYSGDENNTKCEYRRALTAAQATELKTFLESKGF